ncbi:hypothetical protein M405DRAFT_120317 [Rhizopogon salebrosus TDB-379]|nr:hypothetical protein M405DRAFT_120317 [Rhizopogon salebrosus TDB-379]
MASTNGFYHKGRARECNCHGKRSPNQSVQQSVTRQTTSLAPAAGTRLLGQGSVNKGKRDARMAGIAAVSNQRKFSSGGYRHPDHVDLLVLFWNYTAEPIYWE